jgi:hypothetical protein
MKAQTTKKPRFDNAMNFATPESKTKPKSEKAVIRINADIRADLFQKIKIEAVRRNTSIKTLIEELIHKHI